MDAIADQDPDGPEPSIEDDRDPGDDWPPLRLKELPPVDPFPIDVLPMAAARIVEGVAASIGCPPDFPGLAALAVAGGVIGRSVSLHLKDGYIVGPAIFGCCIGPPSDGKTPALKLVAAAVRRIERELVIEYEAEKARWEEDIVPPPDGRKGATRKPWGPKPRRIVVDDITIETIPLILADNPRGVIMIRDELSALLLGMNQYKNGKGNDRANILKIWSGDDITKDRVAYENHAPIRCPDPTLSIIGGLTPGMLESMLDPKARTDGFIDRFLMVYPDPLPVQGWTKKGVPDETSKEWSDLIDRLWHRELDAKEGLPRPHVAHMAPEAESSWFRHYGDHSEEMNDPSFPPPLRGPWGKLRDYAARVTLILALLEHAGDPTGDAAYVPVVVPRQVDDAWRLISYFKGHIRRVLVALSLGHGPGGGHIARMIVNWIRDGHRDTFSLHDLKQARRSLDGGELEDALEFLVSRNAIRPTRPVPTTHKVGRPPSRSYDVNPALLNTRNAQNPRNLGP